MQMNKSSLGLLSILMACGIQMISSAGIGTEVHATLDCGVAFRSYVEIMLSVVSTPRGKCGSSYAGDVLAS